MAVVVLLIVLASAVVFTLALPLLLELMDAAETLGAPVSVVTGISSFREILGVVAILVFVALFWGTLKVSGLFRR